MERTRVIIADDESLIRMDLREMLTNQGYLVVGEVGDGRSAVNLARELRQDPQFGRLITEDVTMLGVDKLAESAIIGIAIGMAIRGLVPVP